MRDIVVSDPVLYDSVRDMLASLGLEEMECLGDRQYSYVSKLSDGSVMKITMFAEEAASALILMETDQPMLMKIHSVGKPSAILYMVVREAMDDVPRDDDVPSYYLEDMILKLARVWACEDDWLPWITRLFEKGHYLAPLMEDIRACLQRLQETGIHPDDIHADNIGISANGYLALRDLGACGVPGDIMKKVQNMRIGDVITRASMTMEPGRNML